MTVAITRKELGAVELRREARRCRDTAASRRMLALALVLEGASREEAARAAGMDRQTLRGWVHRYDAEGLAGLRDRPRSGREPRPPAGQPRRDGEHRYDGGGLPGRRARPRSARKPRLTAEQQAELVTAVEQGP